MNYVHAAEVPWARLLLKAWSRPVCQLRFRYQSLAWSFLIWLRPTTELLSFCLQQCVEPWAYGCELRFMNSKGFKRSFSSFTPEPETEMWFCDSVWQFRLRMCPSLNLNRVVFHWKPEPWTVGFVTVGSRESVCGLERGTTFGVSAPIYLSVFL